MFHWTREVGKVWRCSCLEKGSFVLISKFKLFKFDHLHLVYYFTVPLINCVIRTKLIDKIIRKGQLFIKGNNLCVGYIVTIVI